MNEEPFLLMSPSSFDDAEMKMIKEIVLEMLIAEEEQNDRPKATENH